ncbi:cytochrome c biogenesis protein CcsA [Alicyclobacillus sp.]|uniref:cytochrome c biogenesis protein n=1 Tax=Alicyclobacillus sp. TaxID=61169 RepID=UPI0025C69A58|nr:cytochrome c biogenesis protein CcsA [Alicyclobacillus sp.]MCL6515805.1 cytochrome c biogenesis protein CcsA [Alicyclobacillus sp.]
MNRAISWMAAASGVSGLVFLYLALIWSPPEQQMGDLVRIMYFHVASAWTGLVAFFVTFLAALAVLLRNRPVWDVVSASSAEIGVVYTTLTLVSGSLWARPIWNTWWTWDPRLTTTLILWFLYVGYLLLRATLAGVERRARIAAAYAVVAFIDVPIIHLSVTWWRSIHPSVVDDTGFHMPMAMAGTLLFGFLAFFLWYLALLGLRVRGALQAMQLLQLGETIRRLHVRADLGTDRGR